VRADVGPGAVSSEAARRMQSAFE